MHTGDPRQLGLFALRDVARTSPRTGRTGTYQVLEMPDFVNVLALTPDDQCVLVRQYRHGIDDLTLEIPAGLVESDESPIAAAERELREETGYAGANSQLLGCVHPNPAFQDNVCHTVLVLGATRVGDPELDDGEDIEVVVVPRADLSTLVRQGRITHSLMTTAFYLLSLYEG